MFRRLKYQQMLKPLAEILLSRHKKQQNDAQSTHRVGSVTDRACRASPECVEMQPTALRTAFISWFICGFLAALFLAIPAFQAQAANLAEHFRINERAVTASHSLHIDHDAFSKILKSIIRQDQTGLNRVDYRKLKQHKPALNAYVHKLSQVKVRQLGAKAQFSYWANLYNALTLQVVMEAYPVATIRDIDISPGLFSNGPWGKKLIKVEGLSLSLDDIEHEILRKVFKDPRVHYAVNCASVGCPNLQKEAFVSARLNAQLDQAAKDYINSDRGVRIMRGKVALSKIYSWFQRDFGGSEEGVRRHISRYLTTEKAVKLRTIGSIDNYFYDWSLNDTAR